MFDNVLWASTSSQINRWRKHTLHIGPTDMGHLAQTKIPFIYNFSPVRRVVLCDTIADGFTTAA